MSPENLMSAISDLKLTVAPEPSRGGWSIGRVVDGEFRWLIHGEELADALKRAIPLCAP